MSQQPNKPTESKRSPFSIGQQTLQDLFNELSMTGCRDIDGCAWCSRCLGKCITDIERDLTPQQAARCLRLHKLDPELADMVAPQQVERIEGSCFTHMRMSATQMMEFVKRHVGHPAPRCLDDLTGAEAEMVLSALRRAYAKRRSENNHA